jgi:hypothetical protein
MKFTTSVAGALMLASSALASPLADRFPRSSLAARAAAAGFGTSTRRSAMRLPNPSASASADDEFSVSESSNWAGAVLETTGVTEVTGTFTIPKPTVPAGGSTRTEFCGAAWVGIDGDTCQSGLIQTGVFWCVENGAFSYEAWFEWIPQASIAYSGISVTAGNEIKVTVTKTSTTGGVTTFENVSTGQTVSHTFTGQTQGTLCGQNAEWIVEDFTEGSSLVPFADFGTVTFTGSSAIVGGATVTPATANADTIILVSSSNQELTSTTVSGSTVTVNYV